MDKLTLYLAVSRFLFKGKTVGGDHTTDRYMLYFMIGMFVFVVVFYVCLNTKNKNSPKLTESVRAIRKIYTYKRSRRIAHSCIICFECANGKKLWIYMPPELRGRISEGDTGMLTHQGTQYIDFVHTGRQL